MARVLKWAGKLLLGLLLVAIAAVATALGYRAWMHQSTAPRYEIATPAGIDEALFVDINGVDQWVTIRGHDRGDPVVLIVHGGPGNPMGMFARAFLEWERELVVVQWDQPGSGATFAAAGRRLPPELTIERMAADGNRLAEWLIERLGTDRIIVLGWSWGSALAVHMVKARPELYRAYIGTGQIMNMERGEATAYANVLAKAERRRDFDALDDLRRIGRPPYDSMRELSVQREWATRYETGRSLYVTFGVPALFEPRTSLGDIYDAVGGMIASSNHFFGETLEGPAMNIDLTVLGPRFDVPVYVVQGADDDFTPASLAREFVEFVEAPDKGYFEIDESGHFALVRDGALFLDIVKSLPAVAAVMR